MVRWQLPELKSFYHLPLCFLSISWPDTMLTAVLHCSAKYSCNNDVLFDQNLSVQKTSHNNSQHSFHLKFHINQSIKKFQPLSPPTWWTSWRRRSLPEFLSVTQVSSLEWWRRIKCLTLSQLLKPERTLLNSSVDTGCHSVWPPLNQSHTCHSLTCSWL